MAHGVKVPPIFNHREPHICTSVKNLDVYIELVIYSATLHQIRLIMTNMSSWLPNPGIRQN